MLSPFFNSSFIMIKTYIAPNRVDFTTGITVNEKIVHINFAARKTREINTATYTTSNSDIQDALENHSRFGTTWVLVEEKIIAAPKEEAPKDPGLVYVPPNVVSHFQTAKKYLIDKGFATSEEVRSKEQVIAVAVKNKIVFAGWNKDAPNS